MVSEKIISKSHSNLKSITLVADYSITKRSFNFAKKHKLPFYFASASDGTNVVKVCV